MSPLYWQIEQDLARKIQHGEFGADEALPTEQQLCDIYGVSRITVRRAVERLVAARLIYRRRGAGTFVNRIDFAERSLRLVGHMDDVLTFQQKLRARVIARGLVEPSDDISNAFSLGRGQKVYRISAANSLDGRPYAVTHSYFSPDLEEVAPRVEMEGGRTSIHCIEELTGLRAKSACQTIEPTTADKATARLLGIKAGVAVLTATRTYYSDRPEPIEVVVVHYHPGRYKVTVELVGADSMADVRQSRLK